MSYRWIPACCPQAGAKRDRRLWAGASSSTTVGRGRRGGVGKTHLAVSLAIAAAEHGRRVYYGTLAGLIESLAEAKAAGNLSRRLRVLTHPALLVARSAISP